MNLDFVRLEYTNTCLPSENGGLGSKCLTGGKAENDSIVTVEANQRKIPDRLVDKKASCYPSMTYPETRNLGSSLFPPAMPTTQLTVGFRGVQFNGR